MTRGRLTWRSSISTARRTSPAGCERDCRHVSCRRACGRFGCPGAALPLSRGIDAHVLPVPMMNVLNGVCTRTTRRLSGVHGRPSRCRLVRRALQWGAETYHACTGSFVAAGCPDRSAMKVVLPESRDQRGRAPNVGRRYRRGRAGSRRRDRAGLDPASSELCETAPTYSKARPNLSSDELVTYWVDLVERYPSSR